jgi:hypothetical protein
MTAFYWTLSILLIVVLLAVTGQQYRYFRWRRDVAADQQPLFHSSSVFHVATVVALAPDQDLLSTMRDFVEASEGAGAKVIYVGKIAANALLSGQIPQAEWNAFVLNQYPSRKAYAQADADPGYQKARSSFAAAYSLGMQRSPWLNLALPVALLGVRTLDIIKRQPARYPFVPARETDGPPPAALERRAGIVAGLLANREYGRDAVVVLNFIKAGSGAQRDANSGYGAKMMSLMAEIGNGPVHMGRAMTLEGDADFDSVAIVYYPGVDYFAEMLQSEFFTAIIGDKQLGDSLSSPTVPLLPHLSL